MVKSLRIFTVIAVLLLIWQGIQSYFDIPSYLLPSPVAVFRYMKANPLLLAEHTAISLLEIIVGLVVGAYIAVRLIILAELLPIIKNTLFDLLIAFQAIPIFAILPLFLMWFGHGFGTKVTVIGLSCFFPIAANFLQGLHDCPQNYLDQAKVMGGRKSTLLWHILLPASLPNLLNGIRIAAVHAPITVIAADWIGATHGLGYLIMLSGGRLETEMLFACIVLICLLSLLFNSLLAIVEKKILYWRALS